MNNIQKPLTAYSEMKLKVLITEIEKKLDKNQQDFWIIRTRLGSICKDYLTFSQDYSTSEKTKQILINYPERLVNQTALLTIKKKNDKEKVINLELEK